jgi:hypothetical protein
MIIPFKSQNIAKACIKIDYIKVSNYRIELFLIGRLFDEFDGKWMGVYKSVSV